ncbi:cobalt transporter ATP-binding subunit [Saccharibacillus sp. O16]|nr:cobalt transporter ATP-binding subunit [Saccharibacillus sp. O16]
MKGKYALRDVEVTLNGRLVLQSITCTLHEGRWSSLIGQTGAGKSTLARLFKGLLPEFGGEYLLSGQPVPRNRKGALLPLPDVGFVFQYPEHQIFETTVERELSFSLRMSGAGAAEIREAIQRILPRVGLTEELLPLSPLRLSGGQKRRVAIASVLLTQPRLLILDEPTAALDPAGRHSLLGLLKSWQHEGEGERSILFISHQMEDVAEYSDEVLLLDAGRLRGQFSADEWFLRQNDRLEAAGLRLPEPIQLLRLTEELSGQKIESSSCREEDVLNAVQAVWQSRRMNDA